MESLLAAALFKNLKANDSSSSSSSSSDDEEATVSELEHILDFEERVNKCLNEKKYEEAHGIATRQHELGANARLLPVLIKCYVSAMHTNRPDKAVQLKEEFFGLLQEIRVEASPGSVEKYGNKCLAQNRWFEAFLMYQLTLIRCENQINAPDMINILHRCCAKTSKIISTLLDKNAVSKQLVKSYMLPFMKKVIAKIKHYEYYDKKEVAFVQAVCMHYLEQCEFRVDDLDAREETLKEAIDIMEKNMGLKNAQKRHIYGGCLNNLGHTYLMSFKANDAARLFTQAIAAKQRAEDYDTEAEKTEDINKSQMALQMSRQQQ